VCHFARYKQVNVLLNDGPLLRQYYYKRSSDSKSKINLKIGQYLMKLMHMKIRHTKKYAFFLGHSVILYTVTTNCRINADITILLMATQQHLKHIFNQTGHAKVKKTLQSTVLTRISNIQTTSLF